MIIEWVGCTGTGKSTIREEVYKNLTSSGVQARKPLEIFLGKHFAQSITNERFRNIILDVLAFPWSIISIVIYLKFFKYCLNFLRLHHSGGLHKLKLFRSIFRKMGLYVFFKTVCNPNIPILVDEGTVHIAHILYANGNKMGISQEELERFCKQVPTPDLLIQIMAPKPEIMERTLRREDKPVDAPSPEALEQFIEAGYESFKILETLNPWKNKTIIYNNSNKPGNYTEPEDRRITQQILDYFPSLKNEARTVN